MKSNNQINITEAKAGMEQFKTQAANEVGVNLQNGYNGNMTSRETGSVEGQMVNKISPIRSSSYIRSNRTAIGHIMEIEYRAGVTV